MTGRLADFAVLFAARLPSNATAAVPVCGLVKSRLENAVHPVVGVSASVITAGAAT